MSPESFLRVSLLVWLGALSALIVHRMLTGRIRLAGLLTSDGQVPSVSRLQAMLATLSVLVAFAARSITDNRMALIDNQWMLLLGASHLLYLGAKAHGSLFNKS